MTKRKMNTTAKKVTPNKLYPGRPNYTGPKRGWFAFLHHGVLFEHSNDVMKRVRYVKHNKPADEVKARLRQMMYMGTDFSKVLYASGHHQNGGERPTKFLDYALARTKLVQPGNTWNGRTLLKDNGDCMTG